MAIYKTASFDVRPGLVTQAQAWIVEFVDYIKGNEPETRLYVSLQKKTDSTSFVHVMVFADEAAEENHRSSGAVKRFTDELYPLTVDGVKFVDYEEVASTQ